MIDVALSPRASTLTFSGLRFICFRRGFEVTIGITVSGRPSGFSDIHVTHKAVPRPERDLDHAVADHCQHEE